MQKKQHCTYLWPSCTSFHVIRGLTVTVPPCISWVQGNGKRHVSEPPSRPGIPPPSCWHYTHNAQLSRARPLMCPCRIMRSFAMSLALIPLLISRYALLTTSRVCLLHNTYQ